MSDQRKIELRKPSESVKPKAEWRFRDIFVDGEFYGYFVSHSCGPNGNRYDLRRADGSDAMKDPPAEWRNRDKRPMAIDTQKHYERWNVKQGETPLTRDQRMIKLIEEALSIGELKPESDLKAEAKRAHQKYEEMIAKRKAEEFQQFAERARQAIEPFVKNASLDSAVNAVVEVMRWAKSQ